jgi:WD40 repeat protein
MIRKSATIFLVALLLALTACGGDEAPLPTQFNLEAVQTNDAATTIFVETKNAPTATPTENRPTLPPPNTPTSTPMPPTATSPPPATLEGDSATGTIYYIYNGDSIIATTGDGAREEFLYTVGMDVPITYLTPSPDGEWLAFVAPGSGSAREVWIMNRDASYTQQVSCLGFADVRMPTWSPDGEWLAFAATQNLGGPLDIYAASRIAPFCSEDTHQLLLELDSLVLGDLVYAPSGDTLFFSSPTIYALDLNTMERSPMLTRDNGFGPDRSLVFNPQRPRLLTYLQAESSTNLTSYDGFLFAIDIAATRGFIPPTIAIRSATDTYQWDNDGQSIVMSSQDSVYLWDQETNIASGIVIGVIFPPRAIFNPDSDKIAYIDADPNNRQLAQIYVVNTRGRNLIQITTHAEGEIGDMVWLAGGW